MAKVKVRIAVAVGKDGAWGSCGWPNKAAAPREDAEMMNMAAEHADIPNGGEAFYWLTAELDTPETPEVAATVQRDQSS